jgi:hypothetical protein
MNVALAIADPSGRTTRIGVPSLGAVEIVCHSCAPLLHRERPNGMFTYSDAAVVAAAIALFALITAAIHFSGIMQPGWSLF